MADVVDERIHGPYALWACISVFSGGSRTESIVGTLPGKGAALETDNFYNLNSALRQLTPETTSDDSNA
jgi:hypothetical protein